MNNQNRRYNCSRWEYQVTCIGYKGDSRENVKEHAYWREHPAYPGSHTLCSDCYLKYEKDLNHIRQSSGASLSLDETL